MKSINFRSIGKSILPGLIFTTLLLCFPLFAHGIDVPTISTQVSTINLPQTGQTNCYDQFGAQINCAGTGQDGEIRAGVPWPDPRFTDNGDDTITDNLTGLIWARDAGTPTLESCAGGYKTWQHALDYIACLNSIDYLNHNDWRLPNINELESLVMNPGGCNNSQLSGHAFSNVMSLGYWSSTTFVGDIRDAWSLNNVVNFGAVEVLNKNYYGYVWPVRSGPRNDSDSRYPANLSKTGQKISYENGDDGDFQWGVGWPDPRFTDNGDGTVTDSLTGLIWTRSVTVPGPTWCNPDNMPEKSWQGALDHVKCLNTNKYLGYSDWRLPNRKELFSLIDFSEYGFSTDRPFVDMGAGLNWSSTNCSGNAWIDNVDTGVVFYRSKDFYENAWPVRSGYINNLRGTVTDLSTGSFIPAVTVSTINEDTQTNAEGYYYFKLAPGTYNVTFSKTGYQTFTTSNVVITDGQVTELNAELQASEVVSPPNTPNGPISGSTGINYIYSTGGSSSNFGHSIQYFFDWGDGTNSGWLPVGTTTASKSWSSPGTYSVKAQARCATDTNVTSSWSGSLGVNIGPTPLSYTVTTNPSGLQIIVDGTTYTASQTFNWTPGSSHTLSVSSPQSGTAGTRYVFSSWSDGGEQTHTITAPSSSTTYTATFSTQYELTITSSPPGGGTVNSSPMGDQSGIACIALVGVICAGYYSSGTLVTLTATPNTGNTFSSWSGELSGTSNPTSITMNGNKTVIANFTEIIRPDLTGEWTTSVTQTCKSTKKGPKCTITGTLTVKNIGNRDASSSTVKFYLSDSNTYDQGDTPLTSAATGKIKAKQSKSIKLSKSFPLGQIITDKYIIAVIDKYNAVKEIDETNNIIIFGPIQ